MGRRPLPPHLKVVRGNPGRRPVKAASAVVIPPRGCPTPPGHLTTEALEEWHRLAPDLYVAGVLTALDVAALAAYAQAYGLWRQAETAMAGVELVHVTPRGNQIAHPLLNVARRARADMLRFAAELGLTPASRGRIVATPPPDDGDPAEDYFR